MAFLVVLGIFTLIVALILRGKYFKFSLISSSVVMVLAIFVGFILPSPESTCNTNISPHGCILKLTSDHWVTLYALLLGLFTLIIIASLIFSFLGHHLSNNLALKGLQLLGFLALAVISLAVSFFSIALSRAGYHGYSNVVYLQNHYYQIFDNPNLPYEYYSCISLNIDTPDYCTFTLDTKLPAQDVANLTTKLQSQGYNPITSSRIQNNDHVKEVNSKTDMNFYYSGDTNTGQLRVTVSRASNPYDN
jgi:hypothetical protein